MIDTIASRYGSANVVQVDDLRYLPSPDPPDNCGGTWQPLIHAELVNGLLDEVRSRAWEVLKVNLTTSNDKADVVGSLTLDIPEIDAPAGMHWCLGFANSNAQRRSLTLYLGSVTEGGLGLVFAAISHNKHTYGFDLHERLLQLLDTFAQEALQAPALVAALQHNRLTTFEANELILRAGRSGVIPWSRLKMVDNYYWPGEHTSWHMLLAFSSAIRQSSPLEQIDRLLKGLRLLQGVEP